jgi:hypothetical protein
MYVENNPFYDYYSLFLFDYRTMKAIDDQEHRESEEEYKRQQQQQQQQQR